jgi:hypothetical protein
MTSAAEPGVYLVRSVAVGVVEEWGPRLAGDHSIDEVLDAVVAAAKLSKIDEQALALVARRRALPKASAAEWREQPAAPGSRQRSCTHSYSARAQCQRPGTRTCHQSSPSIRRSMAHKAPRRRCTRDQRRSTCRLADRTRCHLARSTTRWKNLRTCQELTMTSRSRHPRHRLRPYRCSVRTRQRRAQ